MFRYCLQICAPCQAFTKFVQRRMTTDRVEGRERDQNLLEQTIPFIAEFRPEMVISENVASIKTGKLSHVWSEFQGKLRALGYAVGEGSVCASRFGVPQYRRRSVLIAYKSERTADPALNPMVPHHDPDARQTSASEAISHLPPLEAGEERAATANHVCRNLTEVNRHRLMSVEPGEPNFGFAETPFGDLSLPCHHRLASKGKRGFGDVYTRIHPDRPSPTITTRFHSVSNGRFGHYGQVRGLSLREGAALQSFPDDYEFYGEGMGRHRQDDRQRRTAQVVRIYGAMACRIVARCKRGWGNIMNSQEVCLRILRAESEREVDEIVASVPELSDAGNWYPIDGRETNFNVVTNQASTGSKALTELCTNMVDAVLMKHAYQKGINPTGPDAPQSVIAGVRDLVQLRGARSGVLAEVDDPRYLQVFAERNLIIGVTGGTRRNESLCFTFVDNGEGQHPVEFEDTFLSLSKGNKTDIPFVQGKYNMGSSGVLTYCGRHWYKLIVSRRYDASGEWGWTLVRRRPGGGTPIAEYFKLSGVIPSFSASVLHPMNLNNGERDDKVHISTGTLVKLYDYQMESATSFRSIRESLNENLVSTVLPFRLMDYRQRPDRRRGGRRALGVDERPVNGMEFLLLRRDGDEEIDEEDENRIYEAGREQHIGDIDHPTLGNISVRAIVLGRNLPGWLRAPRNTSRVFHAVNGQVQFKENRAYLSSRCKFPGLKDRIVVIVDASNLSESAHNDVWKGDRENVRATGVGQLYRDEVTKPYNRFSIPERPATKNSAGRNGKFDPRRTGYAVSKPD